MRLKPPSDECSGRELIPNMLSKKRCRADGFSQRQPQLRSRNTAQRSEVDGSRLARLAESAVRIMSAATYLNRILWLTETVFVRQAFLITWARPRPL